jgi:hypothetical protein
MDIVFGILGSLIPLIVLGGIVAAAVVAVRRSGEEPAGPGIGTVRRIFFYGLAFVALMLATSGVTLLLSQVLDSVFGDAIIRQDSFRIAFGLAATVVGFPIWLLLWRAAERSLEQYPAERGTLGRKFYMYLVLGVSAAVGAASLVQLLQGLLTPAAFDVNFIAPVVVWGALWGIHWAWERAEGQPTSIARSVRRLYVYVTSVYGIAAVFLLAAAVGTGAPTLGLPWETYFWIGMSALLPQAVGHSLLNWALGPAIYVTFWLGHPFRAGRDQHERATGLTLVPRLNAEGHVQVPERHRVPAEDDVGRVTDDSRRLGRTGAGHRRTGRKQPGSDDRQSS